MSNLQKELKEEMAKIRPEILKKISTMSHEEIVDLIIKLLDDGVERGFETGYNVAKHKTTTAIKKWKVKTILEHFIGKQT